MKLCDLYDDTPHESEMLWDYVGLLDYERKEFEVVTVDPVALAASPLNKEGLDPRGMSRQDRAIVRQLSKIIPKLVRETILVVSGDELVDGFHRVYVLAKAGVRSVKAVDLSRSI